MRRRFLAIATTLLLAACGGGGGDAGSGTGGLTPGGTYNVRAAYEATVLDSRTLQFTASGRLAGQNVSGSGSYQQSALTSGSTFAGGLARLKSIAVQAALTAGNAPVNFSGTVSEYYAPNEIRLLGYDATEQGSTASTTVTSNTPLPTAARPGDSGSFFTATRREDGVAAGTTRTTWRLDPETGDTARLVFTSEDFNTASQRESVGTTTYRITMAGAATLLEQRSIIESLNTDVVFTFL